MEFAGVLTGALTTRPRTALSSLAWLLAWRWWPGVLALAALLVSLPVLRTGLLNDDYYHHALFAGPSESLDRLARTGLLPQGAGRLSTALSCQFATVDPQRNLKQLKAYGALPWWTSDHLRVAFWRPVASFTHWVDYRLFPNSLALMHLHSLLWFAAVVFAVSILYRRVGQLRISDGGLRICGTGSNPQSEIRHPKWVAGLAALMYVLTDSSYFPTMWLANRNALISLFFGLLALILHDRHRTQGSRLDFAGALACLLLSLLSAEAGIATLAYLFAYEIVLRRERWPGRLGALAPFVAVTLGWRVVYNILGYGATGGGFYIDPVREPLRYALAVLDRLPFLLAGQWTSLPPEFCGMLSGAPKQLLWAALLLLTVGLPAVTWPILRENRRARFWLVGMYASAVPICATVPMSRALVFVAVGAFGLIAELAGNWRRIGGWMPKSAWRRALLSGLVIGLLVTHLPWAAIRRGMAPSVTARLERRMNKTMALHLLWWWRGEDLVLVNAPNPAAFLYDPFRNACRGRLLPGGVRLLAPGFGALEVVRPQPQRLVVRALARSLLDCPSYEGLHFVLFYRALCDVRGAGQPLRAGQRIVLPRMTVEVLRVDESGLPVEAAFDFSVPLEDPSLQWIYWDWQRRDWAVFPVPPIGATVALAGPF
jgi:hypothetical protein